MTSEKANPSRVVIMTGAGRGLGKVMTLALLKAGHRVLLTSTDAATLEETIRESGAPDRAIAIATDISEEKNLAPIVDRAESAFGQVDVLINNAGTNVANQHPKIWDLAPGTLRKFLEINTVAPLILASRVIPGMLARGWGRIINISTSLDAMLRTAAYGGSKAAMEALTAATANDLENTGVTANILLPGGGTLTRMTEQRAKTHIMMDPLIMAAPISWLVSDAANNVNGRRFIAGKWDTSLPDTEAAEAAGASIAWTGLGTASIRPRPRNPG